jgi:hypothetical protein
MEATGNSSLVIDYIKRSSIQKGCPVIYFYFQFDVADLQTAENVTASLLSQLITSLHELPSSCSDLYKNFENGDARPDSESLAQTLLQSLDGMSTAYIILDALDETDEKTARYQIFRLVERLLKSQSRVLITTRIPGFDELLKETTPVDIEAAELDIRAFLECEMNKNRQFKPILDDQLREEIINSISVKSKGM